MELYFFINNHYQLNNLINIVQEVPWDAKLREMRVKCYEAVGDILSAISDLRVILKSQTENQLRYLKLSQLYYETGEIEEALK